MVPPLLICPQPIRLPEEEGEEEIRTLYEDFNESRVEEHEEDEEDDNPGLQLTSIKVTLFLHRWFYKVTEKINAFPKVRQVTRSSSRTKVTQQIFSLISAAESRNLTYTDCQSRRSLQYNLHGFVCIIVFHLIIKLLTANVSPHVDSERSSLRPPYRRGW